MKDKANNLIGMYAIIWDGDDQIKNVVFVYAEAPDNHFIVQALSLLDGSLNVCKLVHFDDMKEWTFYPTEEIFYECLDDWCENKTNRFKIEVGKSSHSQRYSPDTYIKDIPMSTGLRNIIYAHINHVVENVDLIKNEIQIGVFEGYSMPKIKKWRRMGSTSMGEFLNILKRYNVNLKY